MVEQAPFTRKWQRVIALLLRLAAHPVVALITVAAGATVAFLASHKQGYDAQYPYLYARGVLRGYPIFDKTWRDAEVTGITGLLPPQEGMFYPPAVGIVLFPLGFITFTTARTLLILLFVASLVVATFAVFSLSRPSVGWQTRLTVSGLVLLTACARWSFTPVQIAPVFAILLIGALYGLHRDRPWLSLVATVIALSLKLTLGAPFVLLLLLHRRIRLLVLSGLTAIVINAVGFARLGGFDGIRDYRAGTVDLEKVGTLNTPDPWDLISVPRTDWAYLLTGITGNITFARAVTLASAVLVGAFLCLAALRLGKEPRLVDSCRLMLAGTCLSLLGVYHHHYDLAMLLMPVLLVALLHDELGLTWSRWITWSLVPITAIMAFVPTARAESTMLSVFGEDGPGVYKMLFPLATTAAFVGAMVMVIHSTRGQALTVTIAQRRRVTGRTGAP